MRRLHRLPVIHHRVWSMLGPHCNSRNDIKKSARLIVGQSKELAPRLESTRREQRVERVLCCKRIINRGLRYDPEARRSPRTRTSLV
jgi:hypothetical protein